MQTVRGHHKILWASVYIANREKGRRDFRWLADGVGDTGCAITRRYDAMQQLDPDAPWTWEGAAKIKTATWIFHIQM